MQRPVCHAWLVRATAARGVGIPPYLSPEIHSAPYPLISPSQRPALSPSSCCTAPPLTRFNRHSHVRAAWCSVPHGRRKRWGREVGQRGIENTCVRACVRVCVRVRARVRVCVHVCQKHPPFGHGETQAQAHVATHTRADARRCSCTCSAAKADDSLDKLRRRRRW